MDDFLNDARSLEQSNRTSDGAGHRFSFQGRHGQQHQQREKRPPPPAVELHLSDSVRSDAEPESAEPPPPIHPAETPQPPVRHIHLEA